MRLKFKMFLWPLTQLVKTKTDLAQTQKDLHAMVYLKFIPIANWYYNDADHLVNAGTHGLNAATLLVDSIKPHTLTSRT